MLESLTQITSELSLNSDEIAQLNHLHHVLL